MISEKILDAMDLVNENYKKEALDIMKHKHLTKKQGMRKPVKIMLIAAVMASLFIGTAFAVGNYINSPAQAEKVARAELKKMQEMGIFSEDFSVENLAADLVIELPVFEGEDYYFGRIWPHRYSVQWHKDSENPEEKPYTVVTQVDTAEGKMMAVTIEALPDSDALPYREQSGEIPVGYDEEKQQPIMEETTFYYYDNYEDIIPEGMTVDRFCSLLNEYWGFNGYSIVETVDEFYGFEDVETPGGDTLVRELPQDDYYLTVLFEGDQQGVPRYIQTCEFPGYVCLIVGTNHAVG